MYKETPQALKTSTVVPDQKNKFRKLKNKRILTTDYYKTGCTMH